MNVGIRKPLPPLIKPLNSNNSLGDNSVGAILEDVGVDGVPTLVSPNLTNTSPINDNYCTGPTSVQVPQVQLDQRVVQNKIFSKVQKLNSSPFQTVMNPVALQTVIPVVSETLKLDVSYHVADHAHTVPLHGLPQKKGLSPGQSFNRIKHVKGVCCVNPCLSAPVVPNVPNAVIEQSVGGRLQKFWHIWQAMGANPRVVSVLREGYILPFKQRPILSRSPLVQSGYTNPVKNRFLKEALLNLMAKLVVEKVVVKSSLAFYNRLFLVPKPNRKWRPMLDLSQLNLYLTTNTFKMETPETIRLSLQTGEWVTSLDFSDTYFHIPINQRSRKYLRFFLFNQTFQFTSLAFGLAMAPLEFTKVVKEVKLMAQARGIQIHQYLDDWLLRAPCPETCLQHTQTLLALCQQLGWVVKHEEIRVETPAGLQFRRLPFYCEKYTYHFLTIAICWCHPTHWPTLRNVLRNLKRPVSECELACPPSGHVTTLVNNLHYFCWPS